ncbi:tetratricopeptide repeat protein [Lacunisphaera limnophila]|uniref:Tetratricopeptide repeat protein n=1 Tax=Lacunisphaera limnophila TaxID=1838286 RepID=A0A1D8ASH3_9BACT|nr:tetratricopeptide repeat protein [Lacunisphaera limnophila]AOS43855.1 tetratricopeptide repeat protein [Lacunisphaera limnophila]
MRSRHLLPFLLLPVLLAAQTDTELLDASNIQNAFARRAAKAPALDPKRIINESSSFLKEREPEMTAEEYALYEKVVNMLGTNPTFALRLLEGMISGGEEASPAFEFILGNVYYAAGENEKTEASYKKAVERYPTFLRAWNNLGVLYYSTDRFADAVQAFSKSVSLGDRDPTTYGLLGYSLEKENNLVAAEVAYMQALSGDPGNADWQEGLLRLCVQGRQLARAEAIARTLIKTRPGESRFWLILANVLLTDNRRIEALTVLELAAGVGAASPDELILLGDLYAEQNLHAEALAIYTKLVPLAPATGEDKLIRLARSLAAAGRPAEALAALQALPATLTPAGRVTRLLVQAQIARAAQRWAKARRDLETVLADEPMNGAALLALGAVHVGEGDDIRAAFVFEAASRVPEATYRASLELANLELRNRNYPRSVEHLRKALSLEHTDEVADYLARVRALIPDETPATP